MATKLPTSMKLSATAAGPGTLGLAPFITTDIGGEALQNFIRQLDIVEDYRKRGTKYVCDAVSAFKAGDYNLPDLKKYIDK